MASALSDVHSAWAWVVVTSNALAGLWAIGANWAPGLRTRALWWLVAAAELAVFVQVGLGAGLVAGEDAEAPELHMFYGFVAAMAVAILYSYRGQMQHRLHLLYGVGSLFVTGLAVRAMVLV